VATVLRQSGGWAKVPLGGGGVFVFLKLPPAACTIPGYEINLRHCYDSYNHMETSIKIIHDKHFTTRSRQLLLYGNQALPVSHCEGKNERANKESGEPQLPREWERVDLSRLHDLRLLGAKKYMTVTNSKRRNI
jgi:hypothetical protein